MSSRDGREPAFPKNNLRNERESLAPPFPESNAAPLTPESKSCSGSPMPSASPFPSSSFHLAMIAWTTARSPRVSIREMMSSSTRGPSSPRSTRLQDERSNDTAELAGHLWTVKLHPKVAKTIAAHGGEDSGKFRPTIGALISALENNPKQFTKKHGQLRDARAAEITFAKGAVWRAVFVVDAATRIVKVLALGPHDEAYIDAKRRI